MWCWDNPYWDPTIGPLSPWSFSSHPHLKVLLLVPSGEVVLLSLSAKWEVLWLTQYASSCHDTDTLGVNKWDQKSKGYSMILWSNPYFWEKLIKPYQYILSVVIPWDLVQAIDQQVIYPLIWVYTKFRVVSDCLLNWWGMMRGSSVKVNFELTLNVWFQINFLCSSSIRSESSFQTLIQKYGGGQPLPLMLYTTLLQHPLIL